MKKILFAFLGLMLLWSCDSKSKKDSLSVMTNGLTDKFLKETEDEDGEKKRYEVFIQKMTIQKQ